VVVWAVEGAFRVYREHWRYVLAVDVAVHVPVVALWVALWSAGARSMLAELLVVVAGCLMQAWLALPVRELHDDRPLPSLLAALCAVRGRIGALVGVVLVYAAAILAGVLAFYVPAFVIATVFAFVVPAVVLDRRKAEGAFGRSLELVRGRLRQVLGLVAFNWLVGLAVFALLLLATRNLENGLQWSVAVLGAQVLVAPLQAVSYLLAFLRLREEKDARPAAVPGEGATIERPA
jgi:hypothetical protein